MVPAGMTMPWKSWGLSWPCSVVNDRSAMASSGNGLTSDRVRFELSWVVPVAKYQLVEPLVAQAVLLIPELPATTCETVAWPPSRSTTAAR